MNKENLQSLLALTQQRLIDKFPEYEHLLAQETLIMGAKLERGSLKTAKYQLYDEAHSVAQVLQEFRASVAKLNKLKSKCGLKEIGDAARWREIEEKLIYLYLMRDAQLGHDSIERGQIGLSRSESDLLSLTNDMDHLCAPESYLEKLRDSCFVDLYAWVNNIAEKFTAPEDDDHTRSPRDRVLKNTGLLSKSFTGAPDDYEPAKPEDLRKPIERVFDKDG